MKYWLLTTEYPPAHGGGISTYCFFTAQMLNAAGYGVTVFVNDNTQSDINISHEPNNTRVVRFNGNRDGLQQSLGYTARLSYAFAGVVKKMIEEEGKPAFIESQDYLGIAYYLTQFKNCGYSFLSDVPIILTLHSPAFIYLEYNRVPVYRFPDFWTGEMEKQSIAAADALISPTHFLLAEISKHIEIVNQHVSVIPNPYYATVDAAKSFTRNKIVHYGKLSPQKGTFELLAYFKALWDEGFIHPLHIIGGTDIVFHPEMKTMGQLVRSRYGDYINRGLLHLHGKITPAQIQDELQDAHVIIVPSIVDNMPYVVMEAMRLGKVVLASVQGGQREMLEEGISGFLFDHKEQGSFSNQLTKILSLSDESIIEVGAIASERIEQHYSFDAVSSQKEKFLREIKAMPSDQHRFPFLHQEKIQRLVDVTSTAGLLSVVIPFYNMGDFIDDCIGSVTNSSYSNIEILLVNDGSTDEMSIAKLEQYRSIQNITVIDRKNCGLADTRNYGAVSAKGEYLAFLDADDKVAPTYYEQAITTLSNSNNIFFAGSWVQYFGEGIAMWPSFTPSPPYALLHNPINSSGLVYKRNAFLSGGLNDKKVDYGLEDYESVIHMLKMGFNGVVLPESLFYYRVRKGSMFRNITKEKLLFSNKYIAEKHADFYAKYSLPLLHLLNANGPGYLHDNPTFGVQVSVKNRHENILLLTLKDYVKKNEPLKKLALKFINLRAKK